MKKSKIAMTNPVCCKYPVSVPIALVENKDKQRLRINRENQKNRPRTMFKLFAFTLFLTTANATCGTFTNSSFADMVGQANSHYNPSTT